MRGRRTLGIALLGWLAGCAPAHLAVDLRAAARSSDDPAVPSNSVGLRCAVAR